MDMDLGLKALSDVTVFSKYAKYLPEVGRRETWDEIVDRYEIMMFKKYPKLKAEIERNTRWIREKKVLPSMRALQFAGPALEVNNARGFNCAYLPIDNYHAFSETMFLLLGGSGVGYSVQKHHVEQLPEIKKSDKVRKYLIQDSIIGWADAIKVLVKGYFGLGTIPEFDYRDIRPKGARLVTAGGKAPGPEPLKLCVAHVQAILDRKQDGEKLTPLECHDILCHIANSVLAGGIRRSAMICLFDMDDEEMITCKYGNWWELNEQRGRANNSAVLVRGEVTEDQFFGLWERVELSKSGEPGIYWTNDRDWGTNPCCEIGLRPFQFCNLCEVNVSDVKDQDELRHRVGIAAFFGTLQAGFTDFHYLRNRWKLSTERDALLGIGMTGIGSGSVLKLDLAEVAQYAKDMNALIAEQIGINPASRITCVKPSGTTSCVLGTSSGIHAWHAPYYLRTMRFGKDEAIAKYLMESHPELCEDDLLRPTDTLCVRFPIKAPKGSIFRTETALDTLERVKKFAQEWIIPGHDNGENTHNVSATVSIDKKRRYFQGSITSMLNGASVDEWRAVGEWMWGNKEFYNGISVLDYDGGSYKQAPFEDINEEEYLERLGSLTSLDLTNVREEDDNVHFGQVAACAGGACEVG
jgi:ribonucleoside-triphosphate reductase (thioredoxin)